jgi:hypothetical protein
VLTSPLLTVGIISTFIYVYSYIRIPRVVETTDLYLFQGWYRSVVSTTLAYSIRWVNYTIIIIIFETLPRIFCPGGGSKFEA